MKVSECMTRDVKFVSPDQPIAEAARLMLEADTGALPVGSEERVSGMITDRDIAVRAVAERRGPDTPVREVMSENPVFARQDQDVEEVAMIMSDHQIRRLPVVDDNERLVGFISLADLALSGDTDEEAADALSGISEPGGQHNQSSSQ